MDSSVQTHSQKIEETFRKVSENLTASGLSTRYYTVPGFTGYASVTGTAATDVYCLEALLGPAHNRPSYRSYAVAQVFHPRYPSMVLVLMISRHETDGSLDESLPVFSPAVDKAFSAIFLPLMHTAFNSLDPSGHNKGQLVQAYNANMTLTNLPQAIWFSVKILTTFKRDGQLASIAVDFDDTLQTLVARLLTPFKAISDLYHIPKTNTLSQIQIPVANDSGSPFLIKDNSTAMDQGFEIACQYMEKNYQRA